MIMMRSMRIIIIMIGKIRMIITMLWKIRMIIIIIWMMRIIMMTNVRMATTFTRMAGCNGMCWAATVLR